jgi:hypothetical protein
METQSPRGYGLRRNVGWLLDEWNRRLIRQGMN